MSAVELIYDADCPNVTAARAQLLRAFAQAGTPPQWSEWDRGDPASPEYVRGYGSPTVLVNGKDVAGAEPVDGVSCCRLYRDSSSGYQGAPSVESIASALRVESKGQPPATRPGRSAGWRRLLAALPGLGLALLPKVACPACLPAYAGLLGALGLGFLLKTVYLLPLTALFMLVAVGALAFRAKNRRGFGPFILGLAAATLVLVGKFVFSSDPAMYGGIALLVAASLWNSWPRKTAGVNSGACPDCAPGGKASRLGEPGAREA